MGTMHVLTAVAHRPARYRRLVRRTYSLFTLHYSLKTPGIDAASKGSLAKGSWYHRHLRDSQLALPERMGLCGNLQACGIPPVLPEAKPPPFGKGGFEVHIHYHRSNDTGHWRGSYDSQKTRCALSAGTARRYRAGQGSNEEQKATVRNCQRRLAAGHCPPKLTICLKRYIIKKM